MHHQQFASARGVEAFFIGWVGGGEGVYGPYTRWLGSAHRYTKGGKEFSKHLGVNVALARTAPPHGGPDMPNV